MTGIVHILASRFHSAARSTRLFSLLSRSRVLCVLFVALLVTPVLACESDGDGRPAPRPPRDTARDVVDDTGEEPVEDTTPPPSDAPPPDTGGRDVETGDDDIVPDAEDPDVVDVPGDTGPDTDPGDVRPGDGADTGEVDNGERCVSDLECRDRAPDLGECEVTYCDRATMRCVVQNQSDGFDCDDGDPCTVATTCRAGVCVGQPKSCDDGNVCTGTATCDPATGDCISGEPLVCGDGNACELWICDRFVGCVSAGELQCNDNPCTGIETCDSAEGCVQVAPPFCDDGDPCNGIETCDPALARAGNPAACGPGEPIICDDSDVCNGLETCDPETGECLAGEPLVCDDGDRCTGIRDCHPVNGCYQVQAPLQCDDGNACNGRETCDPVIGCVAGTPIVCRPDGNQCIGTEVCINQGNNRYICREIPPLVCDDGNPCNGVHACDPDRGCVQTAPPINCDDGDPCTGTATCDPATGDCIPGEALVCDDGNPCTGFAECTPMIGCEIVIPAPQCDDGDVCNGIETCDPATGDCIPGEPLVCDDGNVCTGIHTCDPLLGCLELAPPIECSDDDVCNGIETCNPANGECLPSVPLDCDDNNPCTVDTCDPLLGCQYQILTDIPCDDGDPCTLDSRCYDGVCVPTHFTCLCPENDEFEPNDTHVTATLVEFDDPDDDVFSARGIICTYDVDWFRVEVSAGDRLTGNLIHNPAYGIMDLVLQLDTREVIAFSGKNLGVQEIDYTARADGALYFGVTARLPGDFESFYDIEIRRVGAHHCVEDGFVGNDGPATAHPLSSGAGVRGRLCHGHPDWFRVEATADRTLVADLVVDPPDAAVTFALVSAADDLLAVGEGVDGRLRLTAAVDETAPVFLRLAVNEGEEADYSVTAYLYGDDDCVDDIYEPNDTQRQGVLVRSGDVIDGVLCPGKVDWYAVDALVDDRIQLWLYYDTALGTQRMFLHREPTTAQTQGTSVQGSTPIGESPTAINYPVPTARAGRYGIRIQGADADAHGPYTLTVGSEIWGSICENDRFEPNNTTGFGPVVDSGDFLYGQICPTDEDWFRLQASVDQRIIVRLIHEADVGVLNLAVYRPAGAALGQVANADDNKVVDVVAPVTGWFPVRVWGTNVMNGYRLEFEVQ